MSATNIGIGAGVVSAIAALVTAVVSFPGWYKDGDADPEPTGEMTRLLLSDPLVEENALREFDISGSCDGQFRNDHLAVEVRTDAGICGSFTAGVPAVTGLSSARVEVDYRYDALSSNSYRDYGAGGTGLRCRGRGLNVGDGDGVYGFLYERGIWEIFQVRGGKRAGAFAERRNATAATKLGQVRRLRLDCRELAEGGLQVDLYVDTTQLGSALVPEPPAAGDVGVVVTNLTPDPIRVAFTDFRVFGLEDG